MMMMMSNRAGGGAAAGRYPFTATQWQELERQALIYNCLASGKPIPSHLMPPLRRILDSALATSPSLAFPPQPLLGWGCYGMGLGRKADEDPEPGRCRRVDGKKWRCSKEAYPGSKYCEKHMHRGKNRSRKPVKMSLATPAPPSSTAATTATSSPVPSYPMPYSARYGGSPYTASAARQGADACQVNPFHLHLDATHPPPPSASSYYAVDRRKKYAYGDVAKPEAGEHAFYSDGGQWQFKQVGVDTKPSATSLFPDGGYGHNGASSSSYAVDMTRTKEDEEERRRHQQQHCFVLGADLRLEKPSNHDVSEVQKPLRPFFDEWPHEKRSKGSWIGFGGETQLSIAIPMAANDPPVTSRYLNDE